MQERNLKARSIMARRQGVKRGVYGGDFICLDSNNWSFDNWASKVFRPPHRRSLLIVETCANNFNCPIKHSIWIGNDSGLGCSGWAFQ